MKLWKSTLLTTSVFIALAGVVTYTACEKDPCTNVSCNNGGSCNGGVCKCPVGFDGPTCQNRSTDHFAGVYGGYTGCNNGAQVIDTIFITGGINHEPLKVKIVQKQHPTEVLYGTVSVNETTFALDIPDRVSTKNRKVYHATLQANNKMTFDSWEYDTTSMAGPIVNKCVFVGFK